MEEHRTAGNDERNGQDTRQPVRWRVMVWWMVATCLGFTLGLAALVRIDQGASLFAWDTWQAMISGLVFGTVVATAQWFVLRHMIPQAGAWILASALGSAAGFALFSGGPPPERSIPLVAAVIGTIVGLFQWALLRRRACHAIWWIVATLASAALMGSFPAVVLTGALVTGGAITGAVAALFVLVGLGYLALPAAIQGGVLVRLFREG
jgi:hypothetical protein